MSLASQVQKLSKTAKRVTRRPALVYDGTSPRPVGGGADVVALVRLHMQRETAQATHLVREIDGDESRGEARVWVSNKYLAKGYDETDLGKTPLGWTELQIAPPEDTDGPPADLIEWDGRRWEITEHLGWAESFSASNAKFLRYVATDRGAA